MVSYKRETSGQNNLQSSVHHLILQVHVLDLLERLNGKYFRLIRLKYWEELSRSNRVAAVQDSWRPGLWFYCIFPNQIQNGTGYQNPLLLKTKGNLLALWSASELTAMKKKYDDDDNVLLYYYKPLLEVRWAVQQFRLRR